MGVPPLLILFAQHALNSTRIRQLRRHGPTRPTSDSLNFQRRPILCAGSPYGRSRRYTESLATPRCFASSSDRNPGSLLIRVPSWRQAKYPSGGPLSDAGTIDVVKTLQSKSFHSIANNSRQKSSIAGLDAVVVNLATELNEPPCPDKCWRWPSRSSEEGLPSWLECQRTPNEAKLG